MLSRTQIFFAFLVVTTTYGFYVISTDDDFSTDEDPELPLVFPINHGFVPQLAIPEPISVVEDDDLAYLDRVGKLQQAIRSKRDVITLADAYSQNIRPADLEGIRLVRAPILAIADEEDYPPRPRVIKRDGNHYTRHPVKYIVIE